MANDAKACFSSKVEYFGVIRYLYFKGKTGKEIHGELASVYGSSAPSCAQVKSAVERLEKIRPLDATNEEISKKVRDLVYSDRRIQVFRYAQANSPLGPQIP